MGQLIKDEQVHKLAQTAIQQVEIVGEHLELPEYLDFLSYTIEGLKEQYQKAQRWA